MSDVVTYALDQGVAVITLNNPPVNALSHALRAGLVAAIDRAEADPEARAILIRAEGRTFPAGADIREFGQPPQDPWLPAVCNRIEAATKPVVAALHGTPLGGGFEVALAAHYRLAAPGTRVGLPEITLGILPGAGGTQRTPRLCGAKVALDLMLLGKPISAEQAQQHGLIDAVAETDLYQAGIDLAREVSTWQEPLNPTRARRDGFTDPVAYEAAVRDWRKKLEKSPLPAPKRIVDCVEAALLLPFDEGLEFERTAFEDLVKTPESAALRHAFFAERRAAKAPELAEASPRPVNSVGLIGGGTMGSGIAVSLLDAGLPVIMVERDDDSLQAGISRVESTYARAALKGRISEEEAGARLARLKGTTNYAALADVDLVIEAVVEDMAVKRAVFDAVEKVARPGAVLATNTSYLDINALQQGSTRPQDIIGLHFFSPANIMKLLEVVVAEQTAPEVVATGFALAKRLGKIAVRAGVSDGFIGNRILAAYRQAADYMLEDGASPYEIDRAMRAYGFKLGPYQVLDLAGGDISWARRKRLAPSRDPNARYVEIGDLMCELGWFGQKTGRGYYRYEAGKRQGTEAPEVIALIEQERRRKGISPRQFSPDEIQRRCLAAMANEGARLIEEEIAQRPGDIDTVMIHGYGFPRWRGGPMQAADARGLLQLRKDLQRFSKEDPAFWVPAPLISELIKNGMKFEALDVI